MKILAPGKKRRIPMDDSFLGIRIGIIFMVSLLLFAVLIFRLWFLQILQGDQYAAEANNNRKREVIVEAPRGVIYDKNGEILVENRAGLSVCLLPMYMPDPKKDQVVFDAEIDKLSELLEIPEEDLLKEYEKAVKNPYITHTIKADVPKNTIVSYIKEHSTEFPGVEVEISFLRSYPFRSLASHVLGYVGKASAEDLEQQQFINLAMNANLGRNGIERQYDDQLRGTDGVKTVEVDSFGRPKRFLENLPPKPGNNLVLTIDGEVQKAAEEALAYGISIAHSQGFTSAAGGAVVAIDPSTGNIIAMASYPFTDPSLWVGGMSAGKMEELKNKPAHEPLLNRAMSALYPPGSTFKPYVASVALDNGVVTTDEIFNCGGSFSIKQQSWDCWAKIDGHGDVNLRDAITQSCDVYFYNLGQRFYNLSGSILQNGVKQFGFGNTATGIDLPYETTKGVVPDVAWKAEHFAAERYEELDRTWKPGDEVNMAIGQGYLLATPLQMAVALAALVNGGTVYVPHLVSQITDPSGNVILQFEPEVRNTVNIDPEILNIVRDGMHRVVSDASGTANSVFRGFPADISVAGKTGTSEKNNEDDYALFIGFAPADESTPQIAVVAIIEQGGHGSSVAAPVVRRVLEAYFQVEQGNISPDIKD